MEIVRGNKHLTAKELQKLLPHRSIDAIYGQRRQLGVSESSKITPEQSEYIKKHYNSKTSNELATYCGVHRTTVERHIKSMGLTPLRHSNSWTMVGYEPSYEDGEFAIEYVYEKTEEGSI